MDRVFFVGIMGLAIIKKKHIENIAIGIMSVGVMREKQNCGKLSKTYHITLLEGKRFVAVSERSVK